MGRLSAPGIGSISSLSGRTTGRPGAAMDLITLALTGLDAAHMAEPVLASPAGQGQPGLLHSCSSEQAELHLSGLRLPRRQRRPSRQPGASAGDPPFSISGIRTPV